ncbi:putative Group XV phospholipase A2 [Monocercomonoides exilis]|uniref:putative Group XV phospholipase A2 n=1 Tax=Monocercomonoides exilis TaxID=2049356 RepID=UPI0035596602|nr:putative Group XV phospholipase A2 [Monocercomonoides exilis]|eukprot:MONOS_11731.1-p1 / transcript=MONOS_11731.1 / gene=MONOS_11731 / organism=Monocercomonoides_exilis_PA203 / gene_product=Lecithin / transcript_product=Lecithin / location=Mono_scaffold00606:5926-7286(+) / protein_length=414 / sequence_SO=supercontig / SO=protein_coding / is_pseudo=false
MQLLLLFISSVAAQQFYMSTPPPDETLDFIEKLTANPNHDPLVIVPGVTSSRLEYKKQNDKSFSNLWMVIRRTIPGWLGTYIDEVSPRYYPENDTYASKPGLTVQPVEFGKMTAVLCIDPQVCSKTAVFATAFEALKKVGYKEGVDLFAAPYDFRIAGVNQVLTNGMFSRLKGLIEKASSLNGGKKVHILGHSAGAPFLRHFLVNYVNQEWKDRYVQSFIAVGGPFAGSALAFRMLATYSKWVLPTVGAKDTYNLARFFAQLHWLLPQPAANPPDETLGFVTTTGMRFTVRNQTEVWRLTNRDSMYQAITRTLQRNNEFKAPRVPMHVLYSLGHETAASFRYESTKQPWWQQEPTKTIYKDGDGTVTADSLLSPKRWVSEQSQPIDFKQIQNADHVTILATQEFLSALLGIITH